MTNLRNLDLSDTGITNEGLVHIAQIKSLRFLDLTETKVTEDAIERLRAELPDCQIWRCLIVEYGSDGTSTLQVKPESPTEKGPQE